MEVEHDMATGKIILCRHVREREGLPSFALNLVLRTALTSLLACTSLAGECFLTRAAQKSSCVSGGTHNKSNTIWPSQSHSPNQKESVDVVIKII